MTISRGREPPFGCEAMGFFAARLLSTDRVLVEQARRLVQRSSGQWGQSLGITKEERK